MLKKALNSPTITTWMSYSTKALSLFVALPLILKHFSTGDVALWYLFFTLIISAQSIAEFGFRQTFSRVISYAFVGAQDIGKFSNERVNTTAENSGPNKPLLNDIISTMKLIYLWLTIVFFVIMVVAGTWSLIIPVKEAGNAAQAWWSWGIIVVVSCINFYGKVYVNYLEGLFQVAVVRRIETLTSLAAIASSIAVLMIAPSLLNLIIVNQLWIVVNTVRDWYLCRKVEQNLYVEVSDRLPYNATIFKQIWQPTWKNGISGFIAIAITNLSGVVFAQFGTSASVASYLLAIRIINQIKDISMAPFYSKLPLLAMLRVKNDIAEIVKVSKRGMFLSHLVFMMGFIFTGLFSDHLLKMIHSDVGFVSPGLWLLLGLAFFCQRFGAMHMQVYLSTNHIIVHIADMVAGALYVVSTFILYSFIGVYALPLGMIIGYLGFYSWYAARYSYASLNIGFGSFERYTLTLPIGMLLLYVAFVFFKG